MSLKRSKNSVIPSKRSYSVTAKCRASSATLLASISRHCAACSEPSTPQPGSDFSERLGRIARDLASVLRLSSDPREDPSLYVMGGFNKSFPPSLESRLVVDSIPILRTLDISPDTDDPALPLQAEAELAVSGDRRPSFSLLLD